MSERDRFPPVRKRTRPRRNVEPDDPRAAARRVDNEIDRARREGDLIDIDECFPLPDVAPEMSGGNRMSVKERSRKLWFHGSRPQRDYVLRVVHQCLMRQMHAHEIAKLFDVKTTTVYQWVRKIRKRVMRKADNIEFNEFVGATLVYYEELAGQVNRIALDPAAPAKDKLAAAKLALQAEKDKTDFLEKIGYFRNNQFVGKKQTSRHQKAAEQLTLLMSKAATGTFEAPEADTGDGDSGEIPAAVEAQLPDNYTDYVEADG